MSEVQTKPKKTTSAKASTRVVVKTKSKLSDITPEQRQHMIAEAAYYRAEQRSFQGGDPQQDWLEAEAEIDHMLVGTRH